MKDNTINRLTTNEQNIKLQFRAEVLKKILTLGDCFQGVQVFYDPTLLKV